MTKWQGRRPPPDSVNYHVLIPSLNTPTKKATFANRFDFFVNEQCGQYDECIVYKPYLVTRAVYNMEYRFDGLTSTGYKNKICSKGNTPNEVGELDNSFHSLHKNNSSTNVDSRHYYRCLNETTVDQITDGQRDIVFP